MAVFDDFKTSTLLFISNSFKKKNLFNVFHYQQENTFWICKRLIGINSTLKITTILY